MHKIHYSGVKAGPKYYSISDSQLLIYYSWKRRRIKTDLFYIDLYRSHFPSGTSEYKGQIYRSIHHIAQIYITLVISDHSRNAYLVIYTTMHRSHIANVRPEILPISIANCVGTYHIVWIYTRLHIRLNIELYLYHTAQTYKSPPFLIYEIRVPSEDDQRT